MDAVVQTSMRTRLRQVLSPQSIAFVGGSNLVQAIRSCESIGYSGDIWVVNPKYQELAGKRCYASVAELPGVPDATFLAVNRERAIEVVTELSRLGAPGCVCYAAGFSESGAGGNIFEQRLIEAAGDMALVGPNCYGLLNYFDGVALWPDRHGGQVLERGVAIISQSGNVAMNLTMSGRSLPVGCAISVGNQSVLQIDDYLNVLVEDRRVSAIGLYIEGLKDVAGFSRAALRALERGVPIVALKSGSSQLGTQLTMSHTSSLAGADELYDALFERLGIIRARGLQDMIETLKLLHVSGPLEGTGLGVLACSGGETAMIADLAEKAGLGFPNLEQDNVAALDHILAGSAAISNPLDYNTTVWGDPEGMVSCYAAFMASGFDLTVLVLDYPINSAEECNAWDMAVDALIEARQKTGRPAAVISCLAECLPTTVREKLVNAQITPLQGMDHAMEAIRRAAYYGRRRAAALAQPNTDALTLPNPVFRGGESTVLDEAASKQLLAKFGLPIPEGRVAKATEAADVADVIGYPVAVKICCANLPHKTEAGAVALNLNSRDEVSAAVDDIWSRVGEVDGVKDRFLVEAMVGNPVAELIIGLIRDPQFGLALVVGSGGILVNLINDSATLLLPTTREEVAGALGSLKGDKLLRGYRGQPAADREAIIDAVMAVAAFAHSHADRVEELDVNPLLVSANGAVAADAVVRQV